MIRELAKARWGSALLRVPKVKRKPIRERLIYRGHFTRSQMIRTEPFKKWVKLTEREVNEFLPERHRTEDVTALTRIAQKLGIKPKREA